MWGWGGGGGGIFERHMAEEIFAGLGVFFCGEKAEKS